MWVHIPAVDDNDIPLEKNRRRELAKKYPASVAELDSRLQQLLDALRELPLDKALQFGWIHPEPNGVFAIVTKKPALRYYFLPMPERKAIVTLTMGAKDRQSEDIKMVTDWAKELRNG